MMELNQEPGSRTKHRKSPKHLGLKKYTFKVNIDQKEGTGKSKTSREVKMRTHRSVC